MHATKLVLLLLTTVLATPAPAPEDANASDPVADPAPTDLPGQPQVDPIRPICPKGETTCCLGSTTCYRQDVCARLRCIKQPQPPAEQWPSCCCTGTCSWPNRLRCRLVLIKCPDK